MIRIEQMAHQALAHQASQRPESEMRAFLQEQYPALSQEEMMALIQPVPQGRRSAIQKISAELEDRVQELPLADLDRFVSDLFPYLEDDEREEIVLALTRSIPPRPKPGEESSSLDEIIGRAMDELAQEMQEQGRRPEDMQALLQEQFPSLTSEDLEELIASLQPERWRALGKVVRQLAYEAPQVRVGHLDQFLETKLPYLPSQERGEAIAQLTRTIPPRTFRSSRTIAPRKPK